MSFDFLVFVCVNGKYKFVEFKITNFVVDVIIIKYGKLLAKEKKGDMDISSHKVYSLIVEKY